MNNYQALQSFWDMFGVDAYDENTYFTEDEMPAYPHITYESFSGTWEASRTQPAHLWNRSESWAWLKEKAEEIRQTIGNGIILHTDEGIIWFRIPQYSTFSQVIPSGSDDDLVKRILLTVEIEFLTV